MSSGKFFVFVVVYYLCRFLVVAVSFTGDDAGYFVDFLDVGQGDAILIRTPNHNVMIDSGPDYSASFGLYNYFWSPFCNIDAGFVSHAHADHYFGFMRIAKLCQPKLITFNDVDQLKSGDADFWQKFDQNKLKKTFLGDEYFFNELKIKVLWPRSPQDLNVHPDDLNYNSMVLLVTYGDFEGVFLGDAQKDTLAKIDWESVLAATKGRFDVIKAAHHGAGNGFYLPMYDILQPKFCVIQVGKDNSYGHPDLDVVHQMEDVVGCDVLRTDEVGPIEMRLR